MPEKKEEKKDKPKIVQEKDKGEAKGKEQPKQVQITLPTLTLDFGPNFQMKLVFLGLMAVIFAFAMLVFTKTNFATIDLVDFARLQYNLPKLWGLWFVVFILVFSLAMALAVLYGNGIPKLQSLFAIVLLFLLAAIVGVIFPPYSLAFYGFALCIGVASIEAALTKELNFHSIWSITSKALLALVVIAFLFAFMKFSASKEVYFNHLLSSVTTAAPELLASAVPVLGAQSLNLCAEAIDSIQITEDNVRAALDKQALAGAMDSLNNPLYTLLPGATKQQIIDSFYESSVTQAANLTNTLKNSLSTQIRSIDVGRQLRGANLSAVLSPATLRREIEKIPASKQLLDAFPLLAAMSVVSFVTVLNFFVHIFATLFAWGLNKLI